MMILHLASLALAVAVGSTPNTPAQPYVRVASDSEAVLTVDAINKMTTFWSSFMEEPDSVKTDGRNTNQRQVIVYIGKQQRPDTMVSMAAMAAHFPSVAADFKKVGLTPKQWEVYRVSLYSALLTKEAGDTTDAKSVRGKNITFLAAHEKELSALKAAGMWIPPLKE